MGSIVNINFNNATITENELLIAVEAATFAMSAGENITISGAGFDPLPNGILGITVNTGAILIAAPIQSSFSAAISVMITPVMIPVITARGFEGSVEVTWWDSSNQQTQPLTAGEPLVLTGFLG